MEKEIKVSVIVPVYNAEKYVAQCLNSIINQTLEEIEVIVINDGSEDGSLEKIQEVQKKDNRIRVINQENKGPASARNRGIKDAKGKYLALWDADDFFESTMLEEMYQVCEENEADICVVRSQAYDDVTGEYREQEWTIKNEMLPAYNPFSYKDVSGYIFNVFNGWAWDKLFRRDMILENKIEFQDIKSSEDMLFVDMALVTAKKIFVLEKTLAFHRVNVKTSVSVTREKTWDCFYKALLEMQRQLLERGIYEEVEKSFINWAANFTTWQLDTLKKGKSFFSAYELMHSEGIGKLKIMEYEKDYFYNSFDYDYCKYVYENDTYECAETILEHYITRCEDFEAKYKEATALNNRYEKGIETLDEKNRQLVEQIRKLDDARKQLKKRCYELETSTTFRLGKAMLWLPCKILGKK